VLFSWSEAARTLVRGVQHDRPVPPALDPMVAQEKQQTQIL
jgi:hypothetical protein